MQKIYLKAYLWIWLSMLLVQCNSTPQNPPENTPEQSLFRLLSSTETSIDFQNTLTEGLNTNVLMYEYFYNGGGVAVGDLNGDNLDDIYFTSNMSSNKLYLNLGHLKFKDITEASGASGRSGPWKTGVTMADVNGDGLLDIYVCYSGNLRPEKRKNELYINQGPDEHGVPSFLEEAEKYGIASTSTSTQGIFFDYDKDGDLDLFLLNHNHKNLPILDEASTAEILKKKDPAGSQFFRNDGGRYIEITQEAGIQNSALSYGLGAGAADINGDGWTDLYVCNDYTAPDFLYINNQDGTFSDQIGSSMGHTSHFSMGNDVADINNDGHPDLFTLDMLPEDNKRQKLLMAPDNYEQFDFKVAVGFHHQYMRNMLQINNGNETFSEIGQLSGISNTDWSWSAQFADFDNDGWKDLYITNGYLRDYTNMDFLKFMGDYVQNNDGNIRRQNVLDLVQQIPSSNLHNYMFRNKGDLTFEKVSGEWGVDYASNSNGAAYADLDNDGDLEIIVNNINLEAFVFENRSNELRDHHFLKIKFAGEKQNTFGLGAKIMVYLADKRIYWEQMPARGYQSSVSPIMHVGLGKSPSIDSLQVTWPSGKTQLIRHPESDQTITLYETEAEMKKQGKSAIRPLFSPSPSPITAPLQTSRTNDFKRQPLLVNPLSFSTPIMVKADVNGDRLEDLFVGGSAGEPARLYVQNLQGEFLETNQTTFVKDQESEDTNAVFADLNGDGTLDLYVCSGGYGDFLPNDPNLQDRIYLNDGKGKFHKSPSSLPSMLTSSSCVAAEDLNGDGLPDLFIGGRVIPGRYPEAPRSYILINDGKGNFTDNTATWAAELTAPGLVTDAAWADLDADGSKELIVIGEWMPILVFSQENNRLKNTSSKFLDKSYSGWWNKLLVDDFNGDGKPDLLVGNQGTNTQIHASESEPAEMVFKDFDANGSVDPILLCYIQGEKYPYVTRDELLDQIAKMRTRFTDYKGYADAQLEEIFTPEELENAKKLVASHLKTTLFLSTSSSKLEESPLPIAAQASPIMAMASDDMDGDGIKDLLLCGNIQKARLRFGKYDANYGLLLKGQGNGVFHSIPQYQSGFDLKGDVRSIVSLQDKWLFGINQNGIKAYSKN